MPCPYENDSETALTESVKNGFNGGFEGKKVPNVRPKGLPSVEKFCKCGNFAVHFVAAAAVLCHLK